jgi:hypothetical protein
MGMFDWVEWEGNKYQSKDTPNQWCDEYRIDELGRLWVEEYDPELIKDVEHPFGAYIRQNNRRWRECQEFSGTIRFYREDKDHGGYEHGAWIEWEAEFKCGQMIGLKMLDGDRFLTWFEQGIEEKGLK